MGQMLAGLGLATMPLGGGIARRPCRTPLLSVEKGLVTVPIKLGNVLIDLNSLCAAAALSRILSLEGAL